MAPEDQSFAQQSKLLARQGIAALPGQHPGV
jgi:hypothetical protein